MILLRLLVVAFNVGAVTFLVYQMLKIYQAPPERSRKTIALLTGFILLLLPVAVIVGIIPPTMLYLAIYPVAVSLYVYLLRRI